jgi:glycosyltransferase involved in cell wall biosynthesis
MRVAIFSECYEPVQNGVTTSVRTLVDELRARGHHVLITAPHYSAFKDSDPFVLRVPSIQTWLNADYPLAYPLFPRLRRKFRKVAPDVLHSHNPFFVGLLAARLARSENLPLVSTYHTLYNHYAHYLFFVPDPAVQSILRWWIPEYYNRCDQVIVPSHVAEESLLHYGVKTPITVIPTAVPLPPPERTSAEARLAARERWGIPPEAPLLLYVGRIAEEKNLELVIDSFLQVAPEFAEARLLVVGGGPHLEACQRRAAGAPDGERVLFAGPTPHDELVPIYAAADLFVFGSGTETQGLVIAEARAAGTPCVVVREGGASETVHSGEDGLVVDSSLEAFTSAVRTLLGNSDLRRRMGEACLRRAKEFTPEAMTERVLRVYAAAIEAKRAGQEAASAAH